MARLMDLVVRARMRKIWIAIAIFLLLPLFMGCIGWLVDFRWWDASAWIVEEDYNNGDQRRLHEENIIHQMENVRCPAKVDLELNDYWKCLWSTSITSEGRKHHERLMWEDYLDQVDRELEGMEQWVNATLGRNQNHTRRSQRVRRLSADDFEFLRGFYFLQDAGFPNIYRATSSRSRPQSMNKSVALWEQYQDCQQDILPGVSIFQFLECVRRIALPERNVNGSEYGKSFSKTFKPTQLPQWNESKYDAREMKLLEMWDNRTGKTYLFHVDFKPLSNEEHLSNFLGADPYFEDAWSVFRYRYNNLDSKQRQPAWSYNGKHGTKEWHKMDVDQFYIPLQAGWDFKKVTFLSELAETYPGIGEIALDKLFADAGYALQTPLDYQWTKDSGYFAYSRFLLPLLTQADIDYYKSKGLLDQSTNRTTDSDDVEDIAYKMLIFLLYSKNTIYNFATQKTDKRRYPTDDKIPFGESYKNFMNHFFPIDTGRYLKLKESRWGGGGPEAKRLTYEMEIMRLLLRDYVWDVRIQQKCLKEMIEDQKYRLEDGKDVQKLINKAIASNTTCWTAPNRTEAVEVKKNTRGKPIQYIYKVTYDNLRYLYNNFYDRKEARQRYSLPKYPIEFPICKHNEPSGLDIQTDRGMKSSLRDYTFGPAAYRLNRFFMFFPLDGSPLRALKVTVGIVDGERLDGSSVDLSGGAVRGQHLTFQYMHIRFSHKWTEVGSEHRINGEGTPMELQMVFTTAGSADPIKYWHVLARMYNQLFQFREKLVIILSVLVKVLETEEAVKKKIADENLNQDPYVFEALAQAAYHFRSIPQTYPKHEQPRGYVSLDPVFRFIDFIPKKDCNFYTYRGSLSWPPCFGYVIWSVYEQPLYISKRQFDQFRQIPAYGVQKFNLAADNFRDPDHIWVAEEHGEGAGGHLSFKEVEDSVRLRTLDRYVLVGRHNVDQSGNKLDNSSGIVGEEMYYYSEDESGSSGLKRSDGEDKMLVFLTINLIHIFLF